MTKSPPLSASFSIPFNANACPDLQQTLLTHMDPDTGRIVPFAYVYTAHNNGEGHLVTFSNPDVDLNQELPKVIEEHKADLIYVCVEAYLRPKDPNLDPHLEHAARSGTMKQQDLEPYYDRALFYTEYTDTYTRVTAYPMNSNGYITHANMPFREQLVPIGHHPLGINPFPKKGNLPT